jgi:predicted Zn-dependent peptidase
VTAVIPPRPQLGDPAPWTFPTFTREDLGHGLRLLHRHLPGRGLVAIDLLLDAPLVVERLDRAGVGVITGWALDEGTTRRDADAFAAALDRIGASLHGGIGTGGFRIAVDAPARSLVGALDLLAEAAVTPTFPAREVDRLIKQRLDQIRQEEARPESRAAIVARAEAIDPGHRSSLPSGGTAATVGALDRDALVAFHADHLLTGPATVVVAGDLSGVDIAGLVAARFAPWRDVDRERHAAQPLAYRPGRRVVVVDKPGAVQTQLIVGRPGPDRRAEDWAATRVAAHVLGGTLTSRLDMVLREEKGYTYGIRTRMLPYRRGGLVQLASGSVHTEVTADALTDALAIMRDFAASGPTPAERDAAVDYLAGVRPLTLETPRALVGEVSRNLHDDLPAEHTDTEVTRLRDVSRDEVAAAAATHLRTEDLVVVVVGDAAAITDGLTALDCGEVEVRS